MSKKKVTESEKPIPLWLALTPLIFLMGLLFCGVWFFSSDSSSGPNQISLLLATCFAFMIGKSRGMTWEQMEKSLVKGISLSLGACLILLAVGSLIGAWMLAGTAPALIYYGLAVLSPSWFFPAALIICAMVSMAIGSSWTTAGTIGLALIGVAHVLGLDPAMTAGAVVSGAYFGDKMSPLSDTTNLAPAMVGTDLFTHVRHMFWTTAPSVLIALCIFTWLSLTSAHQVASPEAIEAIRGTLRNSFNLGIPTMLPLALLLFLALRKYPALPTITAGALFGAFIAIVYQPDVVRTFADPDHALSAAGAAFKGIWQAMAGGYVASTPDEHLNQLLSRGGMGSMLNTIWLILSAMCFGAAMERVGLLQRIVETLLKGVRGPGSLIFTTVLTSIGMNIMAADQYIAIVLPGRMYRLEFARLGLAPQNLSRTLEDAGTMTSALVPWNTCGAFMSATLGVPTLAYAPFAFVNILNPLIAITYGIFNIKLTKLEDADPAVYQEMEEELEEAHLDEVKEQA
ncbi:Na+/H+ antiporter NhaC [Kordiimonas marina]|uniref:Na+/H+ antiporter NhaC n=1 Tax=Kordiimonas marina TaxID=2872312 RepID=UPI001FF4F3F0